MIYVNKQLEPGVVKVRRSAVKVPKYGIGVTDIDPDVLSLDCVSTTDQDHMTFSL